MPLLPALTGRVIVPQAVVEELATGLAAGVELPVLSELDWVAIRHPASTAALRLVTDLGRGEAAVLALALEIPNSVVVLDDALARQIAEGLGLRFTGTLGLLLAAKRRGLVPSIAPLRDQLQALRFRLDPRTRLSVLKLAGELP